MQGTMKSMKPSCKLPSSWTPTDFSEIIIAIDY